MEPGCENNRVHSKLSALCHVTQSLYPLADKTNYCWHILLITAAIWWAIGVTLWIAVGVVMSNPPNDSKWTSCLVTVHVRTY